MNATTRARVLNRPVRSTRRRYVARAPDAAIKATWAPNLKMPFDRARLITSVRCGSRWVQVPACPLFEEPGGAIGV